VSNEARNKFLVKRDIFSPFFGREFLNNQNIDPGQGDQIGRIFAYWAIAYFGQFC
jgi:hypothetical protein